MNRLALLLSGQGGQHAAMFALTADAPEAQPIFAQAAPVLGTDPRAYSGDLFGNRAGQILCVTAALAAHAVLRGQIQTPGTILAGYSVGELAAWGCAGVFDAATTLQLAAARADAMDGAAAATGGGLLAVRGVPRAQMEALCAAHNACVAINNGDERLILGGTDAALRALADAARGAGAVSIKRLAVSVPSHTVLLRPAVEAFHAALVAAPKSPLRAGIRLLSGIDGMPVFDLEDGLNKLAAQIAQTVDWAACLEACAGAVTLELGPGTGLARMAAEAGLKARGVDDFRGLGGATAWVQRERA